MEEDPRGRRAKELLSLKQKPVQRHGGVKGGGGVWKSRTLGSLEWRKPGGLGAGRRGQGVGWSQMAKGSEAVPGIPK